MENRFKLMSLIRGGRLGVMTSSVIRAVDVYVVVWIGLAISVCGWARCGGFAAWLICSRQVAVVLCGLVMINVWELLWETRIDSIRLSRIGTPRDFSMPITRVLVLGLGSYSVFAWL